MEGRGGRLKVLNLQMSDMARQVENAIQFGQPVLLQDILQEVDPILEPVLAKAFIKRGNQTLIKLGDKEVRSLRDWRLGTWGREPRVLRTFARRCTPGHQAEGQGGAPAAAGGPWSHVNKGPA